ncbi:MAG: alanine racemase, partial [Tumebacillaceae bacterium]
MAELWQSVFPMAADELDTPLVVVHRDVLKRNVEEMAAFAKAHGVQMRPHLKTHKTLEIAKMQLEAGAVGLTCAKLSEAEVYVANGFTSVLIAYPIVGGKKMQRLCELIAQDPDAEIQTLVDNADHA